jgi:hypothetical protein
MIAPRLIAQLVSDRDASIVAKDPEDQAITFGERARWRWSVTPRSGDPLTLTVRLSAPVIIDGQATGHLVKSFEKTVTVRVTTGQKVGDALVSLKENWVLLTASATGLVAAAKMVRIRRSRRRAGFGDGRQ